MIKCGGEDELVCQGRQRLIKGSLITCEKWVVLVSGDPSV